MTRPHGGRREEILEAAKIVFVREGYFDTRLVDIAEEAGCSVGTVYTYFDGRDQLLYAVLESVETDMRARSSRPREGASPAEVLAITNREYLQSYRRNAQFMALLEQVSQVQPTFRELRKERARRFASRNAEWLKRLQLEGQVAAAVDVEMMAIALSAMVSRLAYATWVDGEHPDDSATFERILATVNRAWCASLGLKPDWKVSESM